MMMGGGRITAGRLKWRRVMNKRQIIRLGALVLAAQDMYVKLHGRGYDKTQIELRALQHQRAIFDAIDVLSEINGKKWR